MTRYSLSLVACTHPVVRSSEKVYLKKTRCNDFFYKPMQAIEANSFAVHLRAFRNN